MEQTGGAQVLLTLSHQSLGISAALQALQSEDGRIEFKGQLFGLSEFSRASLSGSVSPETSQAITVLADGADVFFDVAGNRLDARAHLDEVSSNDDARSFVGTLTDGDDRFDVAALDDPVTLAVVGMIAVIASWSVLCLVKHISSLRAVERADARRIAAGITDTELEIDFSVSGAPELTFGQKVRARLLCKGKYRAGPPHPATQYVAFADQ